MSLETVLKIGKVFRESKNGLKHFKYVKACPIETDKTSVFRLNLPVNEDFSFDFDKITLIENENIRGSITTHTKLLFLDFKMSDSDTSPKKYLFGDIYYEMIEGKEIRYKSNLYNDSSSLENWDSFFKKNISEALSKSKLKEVDKLLIESNAINKFQTNAIVKSFRNSFLKYETEIENLLCFNLGVFSLIQEGRLNSSTLRNRKKLEELTAQRIFTQIVAEKTGKKKLAKILKTGERDIKWDEILEDETHIENLLKSSTNNCFLHFDFSKTAIKNEYWYEYQEALEIIYEIFVNAFSVETPNGYVFNKTLYKTLCSGDSKNDIQFPGFSDAKKYKSRAFSKNQVSDLFYVIDYASKGFNATDDVKVIVLPNGENLIADDYEKFAKEFKNSKETNIINRNNATADMFFFVDETETEKEENITTFDMVFTKKGGATSPDVDLIELSGIQKSSLKIIRSRLNTIGNEIFEKRKKELFFIEKDLFPLSITWAFTSILGNGQTDKVGKVVFKTNDKFQSHLLKVLPKIYTSNYVHDDLLLPLFIQNTEYSIRQGDSKFNFLKYDFEFLLSIQNTKLYKTNFMKIVNSNNYQMGLLLGELARNISSKINSFEKNYVGNLTRRIGRLQDFIDLKNEIEQKLIMHDQTGFTRKISAELAELVKNHEGIYDKNECAFGFFESYFKAFKKRTLAEDLEILINKHTEKDQTEPIQNLKNVLATLQQETEK